MDSLDLEDEIRGRPLDDIINDVMAEFQLTEKEVRTEKRNTTRGVTPRAAPK